VRADCAIQAPSETWQPTGRSGGLPHRVPDLSSTHERHGVRASRTVLDLTPGNVTTTTRADMMYVVTEYGIVNLKGQSIPERARAMISIAHPDFREDLDRDARAHGLIPRGAF